MSSLTTPHPYSPAYLSNWQRHVHPEGKPYCARGVGPTVITEAFLEDPEVALLVDAWVSLIRNMVSKLELVLHSLVELWVEPDVDNDTCNYNNNNSNMNKNKPSSTRQPNPSNAQIADDRQSGKSTKKKRDGGCVIM